MYHPIPDEFPELPDDEFFFYEDFRPSEPSVPEVEMPRNEEAERAVLSAMLQWPEIAIQEVVIYGGESLFYSRPHRIIAESLARLSNFDGPVDLVILADQLRSQNLLDSIGGPTELADLLCVVSGMENLEAWLELLRGFYVRRELLEASLATRLAAVKGGTDIHDLLDEAERRILSIRRIAEPEACQDIKEIISTVIGGIEQSLGGGPAMAGLATGFDRFDIMTNGLHPGELVVIGGGPGVGKSTFATNLVENIAMRSREPLSVGWFSLQEPVNETVEKLIVSRAGFNLHDLRSGRLSNESEIPKLLDVAAEVEKAGIYMEDKEVSIMHLSHQVRSWKRQFDIQLLVVDSLQLLKSDSQRSWSSYEIELAEISAGLKSLARELNIPVVAFASVASSIAELDEAPPRLGMLESIWPVLEDADLVACFWNRGDGDPAGAMLRDLYILKQRNGPLGKVAFEFLPGKLRFSDEAIIKKPACEEVEKEGEECSIYPGESVIVSKNGEFPS